MWCIANAMDEADDGKLSNSSEEGGNIRSVSVEEPDVFVYYVYMINNKIYFLSRYFINGGGGHLRFG
jgi:hypothetical protein